MLAATCNKLKLMFELATIHCIAIGQEVCVIIYLFFIAGHGQVRNLFCGWDPEGWVYEKTLPVSKFQKKGFLEKDKLIN